MGDRLRECEHGSLRRKCDICDRDDWINELLDLLQQARDDMCLWDLSGADEWVTKFDAALAEYGRSIAPSGRDAP